MKQFLFLYMYVEKSNMNILYDMLGIAYDFIELLKFYELFNKIFFNQLMSIFYAVKFQLKKINI